MMKLLDKEKKEQQNCKLKIWLTFVTYCEKMN